VEYLLGDAAHRGGLKQHHRCARGGIGGDPCGHGIKSVREGGIEACGQEVIEALHGLRCLELPEGEMLIVVDGPRVRGHVVRYNTHDGDVAEVAVTILVVKISKPRVGPDDSDTAEDHLIVELSEELVRGGLRGEGDGLCSLLVLCGNDDL
jgi:hypothetical protein